MSQKINLKILLDEIKGRVREFYPYFLGFYLLSLIVAGFYQAWSDFFYWPAFNISVLCFTLLFAATFKYQPKPEIKHFHLDYGLFKNSAKKANDKFNKYFNFIYLKLKNLDRRTWLKIFIIAVILIIALIKGIEVLNFLVLLYALISVLFIVDSRYSAGVALVFLISCPFLLILKKDILAENSAIYAYYFLVITVLTQIRELQKEKK